MSNPFTLLLNAFLNLAHKAKIRSARLYYATIYGLVLLSAIYDATELGAEEKNVRTPYYAILYIGTVILTNVIASLQYQFESGERAQHTSFVVDSLADRHPLLKKTVAVAKTVIDGTAETLELGILGCMWLLPQINGNDEDKDSENFVGIVAATTVFNLINVIALHRYKHDHQHQPKALTVINKYFINSTVAAILINGLCQNWLYNGPGNVEDRSALAWASTGAGFSLNLGSIFLEKLLLRLQKVSQSQIDFYREGMLRVQEVIKTNLFTTVAAMYTLCDFIDCSDVDNNYTPMLLTFVLANIAGVGLGALNALHYAESKPQRVGDAPQGESQALLVDDNTHQVRINI